MKPTNQQAKVETMFPAIARNVRGCGYVEIGGRESFGFVVHAPYMSDPAAFHAELPRFLTEIDRDGNGDPHTGVSVAQDGTSAHSSRVKSIAGEPERLVWCRLVQGGSAMDITPTRKFRMLLHINPTR